MKRGQAGFTLIELSIVIAIAGILLAAAVAAYAQYYRYQQVKMTRDNIAAAQEAIQKYQQDNGFYPCPADPAGKDLKATNCAAAATGAVRVVDLGGGKRVRIGAMPILDLSGNTKLVPGSGALDGFRRRLTYAVTESQAISQAGFSAGAGAITIKNAEGTTQTATANFLILSHGEDGIGSYTAMGTAGQPCGTGTIDSENCNGDAVFTVRSPGEAASFAQGNASYNDDFADYGTATATAATGELGRFKVIESYSYTAAIGAQNCNSENQCGYVGSPESHNYYVSIFDTAYGCYVDFEGAETETTSYYGTAFTGDKCVLQSGHAYWNPVWNRSDGADITKPKAIVGSVLPLSGSAYYGSSGLRCCKYSGGGEPLTGGTPGQYEPAGTRVFDTKTGRFIN